MAWLCDKIMTSKVLSSIFFFKVYIVYICLIYKQHLLIHVHERCIYFNRVKRVRRWMPG